MDGVYNRKLFKKTPARDELRKLGGIMASSDALLQEALRTAAAAPRTSDLGPMPQLPARQPQMAMPMQQPMMPPQMAMPMQQPMMEQPTMEQPMDPAFMPPQVPESVQPAAFQEGGSVDVDPREVGILQGSFGGRFGGGFMPTGMVDITRPAGQPAVAPNRAEAYREARAAEAAAEEEADPEVTAKAEELAGRVDEEDPETIGAEIIDTAATMGAEITGDMQADLAAIYQNMTGDVSAYEKNIDTLNRGIIGAAIASGTSARATENIAKGLLVGLEAARNTEERRAVQAAETRLALLQAAAKGGRGAASSGAGSRDYRNPIDAYQDAYSQIMNAGEFDIEIPEGMTRQQYAEQAANAIIARSYTPEQLVGTPFEGMAAPGPSPAAATTAAADPEDVLAQAREAIAAGKDPAIIEDMLRKMGIDPGLL